MKKTKIALFDMDNTLCDYSGQMLKDLGPLSSPGEPELSALDLGDAPDWLENRMYLIKQRPGWWRELAVLDLGMEIYKAAEAIGFSNHILTKGPYRSTQAWTEKVEWCREHVPDAMVTISEHKGGTYGRLLVDDWPEYAEQWLEWRPRGYVVMPAMPYNESYKHHRVLRCDDGNMDEVMGLLQEIYDR